MNNKKDDIAIFGGGCFWCTEALFANFKGVKSVTPGYAGGYTINPTYEEVSSGKTGHAEVIRILFDSAIISYQDLLEVFFASHDPTTLGRQGNDIGDQYRSIIIYTNSAQRMAAQSYIKKLDQEKIFKKPIVTQVVPLVQFYSAEKYHQDYFKKNCESPYCQIVISPKLAKMRKSFGRLLK